MRIRRLTLMTVPGCGHCGWKCWPTPHWRIWTPSTVPSRGAGANTATGFTRGSPHRIACCSSPERDGVLVGHLGAVDERGYTGLVMVYVTPPARGRAR